MITSNTFIYLILGGSRARRFIIFWYVINQTLKINFYLKKIGNFDPNLSSGPLKAASSFKNLDNSFSKNENRKTHMSVKLDVEIEKWIRPSEDGFANRGPAAMCFHQPPSIFKHPTPIDVNNSLGCKSFNFALSRVSERYKHWLFYLEEICMMKLNKSCIRLFARKTLCKININELTQITRLPFFG